MKAYKYIALGSLLSMVIIGCNDIPDCQLIEEVTYIDIAFFDRDTATNSEALIFLSIEAKDADTLLVQNDTSSTVRLYVNPFDTITEFYFNSQELGLDTLIVSYDPRYMIESEECGPVLELTGLDTLYYTFDSLSIENTTLRTDVDVNIKIFLD